MSGTHVMVQASRYDSRGQLIEADYSVDTTTGGAYRGLEEKRTYNENGKQVSLIQYYALGEKLDDTTNGKMGPDGNLYMKTGADVSGRLANATFDSYDAYGRLLVEQNYGRPKNWTGAVDTTEPPAGQPALDAKTYGGLFLQSSTTYVGPNGEAGYDAVGNIVYYQMHIGSSTVNQYAITYLRKDDYLESENSGTNISDNENIVPGADQSIYDRRGNRVGIVQHIRYAGGSSVADTLRSFAYDGHGQIISRRDATDKNGVFDQGVNPASQNQHYIYVEGNQVGHTDEAGKLDILTQVTAFSSGPTNGYVVQSGDTLKSIAQAVYGNASLWYVIAQANALNSDDDLSAGLDLTIPDVKTSQNDSTTFKPYNASDIVGSTTPTLPTIAPPLPPPSRGHCNVVAAVIVIAVVVVASFVVGPEVAEAVGQGFGGFVAGAAAGAAAGSAAGQLAGDALGTHQGFSFGEVFTAAATAAVTAGVSYYLPGVDTAAGVGTSAGGSTTAADSAIAFGERALQSGAGYVAQDAAGKLVGQNEHFSWAGLVSSSLAGAVSGTVGPSQAQLSESPLGTSALRVGAAALVEGGVQRGVGKALGDRYTPSLESIGTVAVGSALGASVGIPYAQAYADRVESQRAAAAQRQIPTVQATDSELQAAVGTPNDGYSLAAVGRNVSPDFRLSTSVRLDAEGQVIDRSAALDLEGLHVFATTGPSVFDIRSVTLSADAAVHSLSMRADASERSNAVSLGNPGTIDPPVNAGRSQVKTDADPAQAVTLGTNYVTSTQGYGDQGYNAFAGVLARSAGSLTGLVKSGGELALGAVSLVATSASGIAEDVVGTGGLSDHLFGARTTTFDGSNQRINSMVDAAAQFVAHPIKGIGDHLEGLSDQLETASALSQHDNYTDQFFAGVGVGDVVGTVAADVYGAGEGLQAAGRLGAAGLRTGAAGLSAVREAASSLEYVPGTGVTGSVDGTATLSNSDVIVPGTEVAASTRVSSRPSWLQRLDAGNAFNAERASAYPYNEVYIESPSGSGYTRLDSYNPNAGEIVSRKFTQLSDIQTKTAVGYINEIPAKYPVGATVASVPSSGPLAGQLLQGQYILEVPVQTNPIPRVVLDVANEAGVLIRDVNGKIY